MQAYKFHRCSLRGDSRDPTVAASCRICRTLTRWSMSRLCFACLLLFRDRCRDVRWVFLGPCTQVHCQVVPPPSGRGRGWRGRRELAPRCSATQLAALRHDPWTDTACSQTRRTVAVACTKLVFLVLHLALCCLRRTGKLDFGVGVYFSSLHWPTGFFRTLVILGVLFGNFSSFLSNGLVSDCLVKRLVGLTLGLTVPF